MVTLLDQANPLATLDLDAVNFWARISTQYKLYQGEHAQIQS
jgi:hypothetical protein